MPSVIRIAQVCGECVACGSCVKVCPFKAITIYKGLWAEVSKSGCRGCGKCVRECPAGVIRLLEVKAL